jgi:hypothetical protein
MSLRDLIKEAIDTAPVDHIVTKNSANELVEHIMSKVEWVPDRWWRSIAPDGSLWGESSDEEEIRRMARPDDKIQRLWQTDLIIAEKEWRDAPEVESVVPKCGMCGRERTLQGADVNDYTPLQVIAGAPLGWYSGDDGEVCPEDMTNIINNQ